MTKDSLNEPDWLTKARVQAIKYITLFVNNPGLEKIVKEFDPDYVNIKDTDKKLDYLATLAATHWDSRKGRERYEIAEANPLDEPGLKLGKIIQEGAHQLEIASASTASLKHYSILAVLGGANKSPYYRLKYALEQDITYDMLAYLGSEREVLAPEQALTKDYAPGAQTEFDLGKGAIMSLLGDELADGGDYEMMTSEWHIAHEQLKNGISIFLLSAPPYLGDKRANTADTYDFLRRLEQESLAPAKNILFATGSLYRYAQYFDAVREISLRTGVDIEVVGFEPAYGGMDVKPSQLLQELKSATDAAIRLRDAVQGKEEKFEWRERYYNRFERDEADRPQRG